MQCLKLPGQRLRARDFEPQVAEFQIRVAVMNGFTAPSHGLQANRCRATDGAFDTSKCHDAIAARGAAAILAPRKNAKPWQARHGRGSRAQRGPARIQTLRPDDLATLARFPPPKPRRNMSRARKQSGGLFSRRMDAVSETAGPTAARKGLRTSGRRVPDPCGRHERLHFPRHPCH